MDTIEPSVRRELLSASDDVIEDAVKYTDPMVLRGLLYQLTGDAEVLETEIVTTGYLPAPASEEIAQLLRQKAAAFLKSYRDAGASSIEPGVKERLKQSVRLTCGREFPDEDIGLYLEELALDPMARSLAWKAKPNPKQLEDFSVTVIGAGMGGLNAALQLKRAGIKFTLVEKNGGVGGTWHENRYPGARVDTPSRTYTHIVGADFDYPNIFSPQKENQRYFDWVADKFELRRHIQFNTEVQALVWNERDAKWDIHLSGPNGKQTLRSNAVVTAVGFLNRPNIAKFEGQEEFKGQSWHTSRWPEGFDMRGKRVAVIGTGATGYQMIPEIALDAKHLTVFQRTPQWISAVPGYRSPMPPQMGWLDRNLPYHTNFMRLRMCFAIEFSHLTDIDPEFKDPHSRSLINSMMRQMSIDFLKSKLGDSNLVEIMTPRHPPFSARPIVVDTDYSVLDAIKRDNVTLVTSGIERINRTGIEDKDRVQHDVDVIVYATGFHATEYLYPMTITGRGGKSLEAYWADGGARAYRCCMVPGFPNLWSIYGPNTNGALSVSTFHEMIMSYAMKGMEKLILEGKRSIEPKEDAYWKFAETVDQKNRTKVWSDPRAHNYYWTKFNRSAVMNPFSATDMWHLLHEPDFSELEIR